MTSGGGVRAVCGALITVIGVALGISGAVADDFVGSEQIGASEADDAASMAMDGSGRVLWSRQPGTSDTDHAYAVATDGDGNVYVVGWTSGALGGANKGGADGWVIKFAGDGRRLWSRQPGSSTIDQVRGASTDRDGNVYVVGDTGGIPDDVAPPDAWVIKFAGNGRRLWSRQPGTSGEDHSYAVATDTDGNVYVVGGTYGALAGPNKGSGDAWVMKFSAEGHQLWSRQPGTSTIDDAFGVATDGDGNVYVVGQTYGALGGANKGSGDAWVIKFDADGRPLWSRQPGTSEFELAFGVATDTDGNVSVVGYTLGALAGPNRGSVDAWVIKFDGDGRRLWGRQPGTSDSEWAHGVATDRDGNVSVVGLTEGALGGAHKGGYDAWVIKFDGDGRRLWSRQHGTSGDDWLNGVATDTDGNISVVGWTPGALGGPNKGWDDAWVVKYAR